MVRSGERPCAEVALEGLEAGVLPVVPGQLVRPGELPLAAFPGALVGLLARVRALVGLQVRALGVDLVAIGEVALVNLPLLEAVGEFRRRSRTHDSHVLRVVVAAAVVVVVVAAGSAVDQHLLVLEGLNLRLGGHEQLLRDGVVLQ